MTFVKIFKMKFQYCTNAEFNIYKQIQCAAVYTVLFYQHTHLIQRNRFFTVFTFNWQWPALQINISNGVSISNTNIDLYITWKNISNAWMTGKLPDVSGEESSSIQMTLNRQRQGWPLLFKPIMVIETKTDHCIVHFGVGLLSVNMLYALSLSMVTKLKSNIYLKSFYVPLWPELFLLYCFLLVFKKIFTKCSFCMRLLNLSHLIS